MTDDEHAPPPGDVDKVYGYVVWDTDRKDGPVTIEELHESLPWGRGYLRACLDQLVDDGRVAYDDGKYEPRTGWGT